MRHILDESHIHPDIRDVIDANHRDLVETVQQEISEHNIVVIGMQFNPHVKRVRGYLKEAGIPHRYLEYGGYQNLWRRRNALKMWTGWPTFPMVFVNGVLIGGADETKHLLEQGTLQTVQPDA